MLNVCSPTLSTQPRMTSSISAVAFGWRNEANAIEPRVLDGRRATCLERGGLSELCMSGGSALGQTAGGWDIEGSGARGYGQALPTPTFAADYGQTEKQIAELQAAAQRAREDYLNQQPWLRTLAMTGGYNPGDTSLNL